MSTFTRCCDFVVTQQFFLDARVGLNNLSRPIERHDQTWSIRRPHRTRNNNTGRHRTISGSLTRRRTAILLADRPAPSEFKFGFDYAHSAGRNRVSRFDDVDRYSSATGRLQNVTCSARPSSRDRRRRPCALGRTVSLQRLTVTAGRPVGHLNGTCRSRAALSAVLPQPARGSQGRRRRGWKALGPRSAPPTT